METYKLLLQHAKLALPSTWLQIGCSVRIKTCSDNSFTEILVGIPIEIVTYRIIVFFIIRLNFL